MTLTPIGGRSWRPLRGQVVGLAATRSNVPRARIVLTERGAQATHGLHQPLTGLSRRARSRKTAVCRYPRPCSEKVQRATHIRVRAWGTHWDLSNGRGLACGLFGSRCRWIISRAAVLRLRVGTQAPAHQTSLERIESSVPRAAPLIFGAQHCERSGVQATVAIPDRLFEHRSEVLRLGFFRHAAVFRRCALCALVSRHVWLPSSHNRTARRGRADPAM